MSRLAKLIAVIRGRESAVVLLDVARGGRGKPSAEVPVEEMVAGAMWHGMVGYVYPVLRGRTPHDPRLDALRRIYEAAVYNHLTTLADLDWLASNLDELQIPWLVFKGPVASESLHGRADRRSYADLDVLVPPEHIPELARRLEDLGLEPEDVNWALLLREGWGEMHYRLPNGTPLDLHWHVVNKRILRRRLALDTTALLDHRRHVLLGSRSVPTMDPVDTLLHLCVHACLSGGDRLIWLRDISLAAEAEGVDWREVVGRAKASRTTLMVAVMLQRTAATLRLPSLQHRAQNLAKASPWWWLLRWVDRVSPLSLSGQGGHWLHVLTASTSSSFIQSAGVLLGRLTQWLRKPLDPERGRRSDRFHPEGGMRAKGDYLEWVARQTTR